MNGLQQSGDNVTVLPGGSSSSGGSSASVGGSLPSNSGRSIGIKYPPEVINSPVSPINISNSTTDNDGIDSSLNEEESDS